MDAVMTMKLSSAIYCFHTQLRADGKSSSTQQAYLCDLNAFADWFGPGIEVKSITPEIITKYLSSEDFTRTRIGRPKNVVSLNRSKSAIRTFFRFTVDAGYLKRNPGRLIRLARIGPSPPRPIPPSDVKKLLSTMKKHDDVLASRDHAMFTLMLGTGIRLGSLVTLNIADVCFETGTLAVRSKGRAAQLVYLNTVLVKELRHHLKVLDAHSPALFRTRAGRRVQARQIQLRFRKWLRAAGIDRPHTVHSLRHTFATRLYERTGDLRLVQRALGHNQIGTTEIYTQVADSRLSQEVRTLDIFR
jgi:site-specific recombinase XerD